MNKIEEIRIEVKKDCYDEHIAKDVQTRCEDFFQLSGAENHPYYEKQLIFLKRFGFKRKKSKSKKHSGKRRPTRRIMH